MTEEKSIEVTFKLYLPEHQNQIWMYSNAHEMWSALYDLKQECRNQIKHGSNVEIIAFCERLNEIIYRVDVDKVS